ncbi:MAG TPA: Hsp70 family protein [Myxococcales bacterium]
MRKALLLLVLLAACKKETRPPSLGEPLSVEQPGGSVAQLFSQGSEIPTSATESFTTKKDGEKHILIHILRGAGRTADKLHSDGWWMVDGLNSAKAGEPRVLVTFELDGQGQVSLSAREDERRLAVKKVDKGEGKLAPSPLTEPDDDEDLDEDQE